jgi:hypothetical protein
MSQLKWTGLLAGAIALGFVSPALSHHSHAMFDHTKQVSVTGTVTDFDYRNPHASFTSTSKKQAARRSITGSRCPTSRT